MTNNKPTIIETSGENQRDFIIANEVIDNKVMRDKDAPESGINRSYEVMTKEQSKPRNYAF